MIFVAIRHTYAVHATQPKKINYSENIINLHIYNIPHLCSSTTVTLSYLVTELCNNKPELTNKMAMVG